MPVEFDSDDDERAAYRGRIGLTTAATGFAVLAAISIYGLNGNSQFRSGALDEAQLLIAGQHYELTMHCGDLKKDGLGKTLFKGFLGANTYSFRAWNDSEARKKAAAGLGPGCRMTTLYRVEKSWFSDEDQHHRI